MSSVLERQAIDSSLSRIVLPTNCSEDLRTTLQPSLGNLRRFFGTGAKIPGITDKVKGWSERSYQLTQLEAVSETIQNQPNVYTSQNTFYSARRRISNIADLNGCFIDLDMYRDSAWNIAPTEQRVEAILARAADHNLPQPSLVYTSGQGMYVKWLFDRAVPASRLPEWKHLTAVLGHIYASLCADASAKDCTRLLRPAGSLNSKKNNGQKVEAICGSLVRYSFDDLLNRIRSFDLDSLYQSLKTDSDASSRELGQQLRRGREKQQDLSSAEQVFDFNALNNFASIHEPTMLEWGTNEQLNWARFSDLKMLAELRGGIREGYRNTFLLWMTSSLMLSGQINKSNFDTEMVDLVRAFPGAGVDFDPIGDGTLKSLRAKLETHEMGVRAKFNGRLYSPIYTASNDTIINALEITDEEMRQLTTIISASEKQRRRDEKDAPGRIERRLARSQRNVTMLRLHEEGKTMQSIADELKISKSQVSRTLASIRGATVAKEADGQVVRRAPRARRSISLKEILKAQRLEQQQSSSTLAQPPLRSDPVEALAPGAKIGIDSSPAANEPQLPPRRPSFEELLARKKSEYAARRQQGVMDGTAVQRTAASIDPPPQAAMPAASRITADDFSSQVADSASGIGVRTSSRPKFDPLHIDDSPIEFDALPTATQAPVVDPAVQATTPEPEATPPKLTNLLSSNVLGKLLGAPESSPFKGPPKELAEDKIFGIPVFKPEPAPSVPTLSQCVQAVRAVRSDSTKLINALISGEIGEIPDNEEILSGPLDPNDHLRAQQIRVIAIERRAQHLAAAKVWQAKLNSCVNLETHAQRVTSDTKPVGHLTKSVITGQTLQQDITAIDNSLLQKLKTVTQVTPAPVQRGTTNTIDATVASIRAMQSKLRESRNVLEDDDDDQTSTQERPR